MKGIDENYSYGGLQRVQHRGSTTIGKTKMMHPSYEAWKDACDTMMRQKRRLTSYFQWYPFSVLSETNWEILSSETFFSTYIQDGAFLICYSMRFTTKGFIQKQGAAFRDSVLVSPPSSSFICSHSESSTRESSLILARKWRANMQEISPTTKLNTNKATDAIVLISGSPKVPIHIILKLISRTSLAQSTSTG